MKLTRFEIESLIDQIRKEIQDEFGIDDDHYYGDCYPIPVLSLENTMERASNSSSAVWQSLAREYFRDSAQAYIECMEEEQA